MNPSTWKLVLGIALAVVVPAGVLHALAGAERHALGLTIAPFAWPRLLVAHLAAAVPLGLVVARAVGQLGPARGSASVWGWAAAGAGVAGLGALLVLALAAALDAAEAGLVTRTVARSAVAFLL